MQVAPQPRHYSLEKGGKLLRKQNFLQTEFQRPISYSRTIRETPDGYHIEAIKQFKRELDQMRRDYQGLRRAYWYLLGYRIEGDDRVPRLSFPRDKNQLCVTEGSEHNERDGSPSISVSDVNEAIFDIDEKRKKIDNLDNRMTESIIQFRGGALLKTPQSNGSNLTKSAWNGKTKTEYDEELEDQLESTLKQNKALRNELEKTRLSFNAQSRQVKESYEEHIRKLEQILERERRHTKMLNGVIERMRGELGMKDGFIKSVMKMKGNEKNAVQKLIKQFKLHI